MNNFNEIVKQTDRIVKTLGSRWLKDAWQNEKEIDQVLSILSDEESRNIYSREIMWGFLNTFLKGELAAQMAGMMSADKWRDYVIRMLRANPHPEIEAPDSARGTLDYSRTATFILEQYKYKDRVRVRPGEICLDLGACLGDTSLWMLDQGAKAVYAFEIEKSNRAYMAKTLAKDPAYAAISIVPKAVSDQNTTLYSVHNDYNTGACHITDQKPASGSFSEIECVTLDSFCANSEIIPNFIKMDIEGAELDAINGAASVLQSHRPEFAICIYHKREHRWQIPLRLNELCPDYEFYVKKSHPVFETVFYGRPKEKGGK